MATDEEFEEYESVFEDEGDALNLAIVVFEDELARVTHLRVETEVTLASGPVKLIWSTQGKDRKLRLLVLEPPPGNGIRPLASASLTMRIEVIPFLARFAEIVREREGKLIAEIRKARDVMAAITRALKATNDAHS